uniref:hypothetical protein n=1 Tax=Pseudoduganella sp. OTU4001 TaxID=3043854 RepID=UPI00313B17A5
MIPVDPVPSATAPVPANTAPPVVPAQPAAATVTAPSVSSLGLFLSNLVLAQRSVRELAASGGDAAAFADAAQQLVGNVNANSPASLAAVLSSQQAGLAQAGISVGSDGVLAADQPALEAAFNASPQRALSALDTAIGALAQAAGELQPSSVAQALAEDAVAPAAAPSPNLAELSVQERAAAERLAETRREAQAALVVNEQEDTQQQRAAELQAAEVRQLTSTREQDLAAQALADRLEAARRAARGRGG